KLFRSYRSTWEITAFAQSIFSNPNIIPMERHGEPPVVRLFNSNLEELEEIKNQIGLFENSGRQALGIICKTQEQAETVYNTLKSPGINLLTPESTSFTHGVIITTAHLAKGLEFDEVIVPFASANNYRTDVDKSMLYIACTRAMHRLVLFYTKEISPFIKM
ncbi:MAG TPA: 3'-5' exonuclease, partial [Chryseolinea sp.]|nr:3'-5' exonuclease [Chryseolinea sp.]